MDERLDDMSPEHDWREEAAAVIKDIQDLVKNIVESDLLESDNKLIYLNLTTLEDKDYTIELSALGFRVVGEMLNTISSDNRSEHYYDTPYALLSTLSPSFQHRLNTCLAEKLKSLRNENADV